MGADQAAARDTGPPFLIDDEVFIFYMLCKELLIPLERVGLGVSAEEFNNVAAQFQNLGCTASTSTNWQEQMRHGPGASFLAKYQKLSDMNRDACTALSAPVPLKKKLTR